jgi:putative transposase
VLDALDMRSRPESPTTSSLFGSRFAIQVGRFRRSLQGGRRSFIDSSVGDAYDNAMRENFFATLECELIDRCRFRSHSAARIAVFEFIEGFYDPARRIRPWIFRPSNTKGEHDRLSKPSPNPSIKAE